MYRLDRVVLLKIHSWIYGAKTATGKTGHSCSELVSSGAQRPDLSPLRPPQNMMLPGSLNSTNSYEACTSQKVPPLVGFLKKRTRWRLDLGQRAGVFFFGKTIKAGVSLSVSICYLYARSSSGFPCLGVVRSPQWRSLCL